MNRSAGLIRIFLLAVVVGIMAGCGMGEGAGGPRELPPETKVDAKAIPRVVKRGHLPKNVNPNASNRDIKGKYAD